MVAKDKKKKKNTLGTLLGLSWRIFFYGALVIILLGSVIFSLLQSEMAEKFLLERITQGLQQVVEEEVSIRALSLDLINKSVTLNGFKLESRDPDVYPAPLKIESITIKASALALLQGNVLIRHISLYRPEINLVQDENGHNNLPVFKELNMQDGSLQVEVRQLDVGSGVIRLNGREVGWQMLSGGVNLQAAHIGKNRYQGTSLINNILVKMPLTQEMMINLDMSFLANEDHINIRADVTDENDRDLAFNSLTYSLKGNELSLASSYSFDLSRLELGEEISAIGTVNLVGELFWGDGQTPRVSGTIDSSGVIINDNPLDDVYADFTLTETGFVCEEIRAKIWNGEFSASGEVANIYTSPVLQANLDIEGFQLDQLFHTLGADYIKMDSELSLTAQTSWDFNNIENSTLDVHLSGQVDSRAYEEWKDSVEINRQERIYTILEQSRFPLAFSSDLKMENGVLAVQPGSWLAVADSIVELSGEISPDNFHFKVESSLIDSAEASLVLANVDRFFGASFPELEQVYGVASFIRLFDASGSFTMDLKGPADKMSYNLQVFAGGGEFIKHPLGNSSGGINFSGHTMELEDLRFVVGGGSLTLNGTVELPAPGQPPTLPPKIKLNAVTEDVPLADIAWVINPQGTEEILGSISSNLYVEFVDPTKLKGNGHIMLKDVGYKGNSVQSLESEISFGETWGFTNLNVLGNEGEEISGNLELTPANRQWNAELKVRSLDLSRYAAMFGEEADLDGEAELDLSISGEFLEARGNASFKVDNLYIQGAELGNISGSLEAQGKEGTIKLKAGEKEYLIKSSIEGDNYDTIAFSLAEDEIDLTPLMLNFIEDERFYLFVYDGISFRIKAGDTGFEALDINMGSVTIGMEQFALTSKNLKLKLDNQNRFLVEDVHILQGGQEGRNTTLSGYFDMSENGELGLNLNGSINLYSLSDFFPDFSFGGEGIIDIQLKGNLQAPLLYGSVSVNDGFIRHKETDLTFPDFNGDLRLDGERIELSSMSSRFASGVVIMDGFIEMSWVSMEPLSYQFTLQGNNIQYPFLPGVDTTVDASLAMRGQGPELAISGDINITRASYTLRFDPEAEFARLSNVEPVPVVDEKLRNIKLDIGIRGEEGIRVDNNFAQMDLALDLRLQGSMAEPGMTGRAEVLRGEVFYRDRKYRINTGIIDFVNPNRIQPQFDFRAETQVKDYRIFLDFHGSPERLYPELSSDPVVSSIDILNLLAVGNIRENPFPSDNEKVQERLLGLGLSGFLTKQITGEFERRAEDLFGIDRFRIDPFILERGATPTARVTIGEQLTDKLSVVYSSNLSKDDQQVLVFEYRLSPSLLLVGTREEDGSYAVDIHLQHRFK